MYLNKKQENEIRQAAKEIKKLATMETCGLQQFCGFTDSQMQSIKLWVNWFDIQANKIIKTLDKEI